MRSHCRFLEAAIKLIDQCDTRNHKHASVLVKGGKIISYGYSHNRPMKLSGNWTRSYHAETHCLCKRDSWPPGSKLYVIRLNRRGKFAMSKPCSNCMKVIEQYRIPVIYYTLDADTLVQMKLK